MEEIYFLVYVRRNVPLNSTEPSKILLLAIVQSEDVSILSRQLLEQGFRLTQINATGGFLRAGSAVLVLGIETGRLPAVLATIAATCQTRSQLINATPWLSSLPSVTMVTPVEVLVGGAVVFGLPVERFLRFPADFAPPTAVAAPVGMSQVDAAATSAGTIDSKGVSAMHLDPQSIGVPGAVPSASDANSATKLVVAVVHGDDAGQVVDALLKAGHRLTRMNTTGGFFRRGNATLLIGVEERLLDGVLALIEANCRPRIEPNPPHMGMPMYGATIFVLDASHYLRV